MTSPFIQPDNEAQSGAHYKNNIDNGFAVMARLAAAFHVQAQDVPDLTIRCLGGPLWNGAALTEIAATNSPSFTARVTNPWIDRVVLNPVDGSIQIVAGTEDADPSPPPVPGGMLPLAAVTLSPAQEEIVNADIKDERIAGGGVARINYNGDGPPTVDDDITQGYIQNSAWYDMTSTPREKYICIDPAVGEAEWQKGTLTLDELVPLFATTAQGAKADTALQPGDISLDWQHVSHHTASGDSSVQFTGLEAGWNYRIRAVGVKNSEDGNPYAQIGTGATPTWQTSGYTCQEDRTEGSSSIQVRDGITNGVRAAGSVGGSSANETWTGHFFLGNPGESGRHDIMGQISYISTSGGQSISIFGGRRTTSEVVTSIRLLLTAGNFSTGLFILERQKAT